MHQRTANAAAIFAHTGSCNMSPPAVVTITLPPDAVSSRGASAAGSQHSGTQYRADPPYSTRSDTGTLGTSGPGVAARDAAGEKRSSLESCTEFASP